MLVLQRQRRPPFQKKECEKQKSGTNIESQTTQALTKRKNVSLENKGHWRNNTGEMTPTNARANDEQGTTNVFLDGG